MSDPIESPLRTEPPKPRRTLIGPFNIFHIVCAILLAYSIFMLRRDNDLRPAVQGL